MFVLENRVPGDVKSGRPDDGGDDHSGGLRSVPLLRHTRLRTRGDLPGVQQARRRLGEITGIRLDLLVTSANVFIYIYGDFIPFMHEKNMSIFRVSRDVYFIVFYIRLSSVMLPGV